MPLLHPLAFCHVSPSSLILERLALHSPPRAPRPPLRVPDVTRAKWGPSTDVLAVGKGCYEDLQQLAFFPVACCCPFSPATCRCEYVRGCLCALVWGLPSFVGHTVASLRSCCWRRLMHRRRRPLRLRVVVVTFCFVFFVDYVDGFCAAKQKNAFRRIG